MNFVEKASKLISAQTEDEIREAIALFTDKQKDMMLIVLLKCSRGDNCTIEEYLKAKNLK